MRYFSPRLLLLVCVFGSSIQCDADTDQPQLGFPSKLSTESVRQLKDVVRLSFAAVYNGWSSDEVLLQPELNKAFIAECKRRLPNVRPFDCNWILLNLRKAGALSDLKSTRRRPVRHDEYLHAAEIGARFVEDKYKVNTDRVICEPKLRTEFLTIAKKVAPSISDYRLSKASFALRKSRRLQPELVSRVVKWNKQVIQLSASEISNNENKVPDQPGVYIIRDKTGYLYIGESSNLRNRVTKHLDESDRESLATYLRKNGIKGITVELHAFDKDSDARLKPLRRAYESDLIRSRKPKFNLAP